VTKPFDFEGSRRREIADAAAATLRANVDAMICVPNDRVGGVVDQDAAALDAFRVVDEVLLKAVQGIVDLLTAPGLINLVSGPSMPPVRRSPARSWRRASRAPAAT
jgi:cell division protein FtsZ